MPIKRAEIDTILLSPHFGAQKVPILYTDELTTTFVSDIAFSSAAGILPYLFVGYWTDNNGFNRWYFANARRHEEMRLAIERDIGCGLDYSYGQIWLDMKELERGNWQFYKMGLRTELEDLAQAEAEFRRSINPENLTDDFEIHRI